jgi:hypothetical protein
VREPNIGAFVKVCVPAQVLLVVVPNARERVTPPVAEDACTGYVPVSEVTPVLVMVRFPAAKLVEIPVPAE